MNLHLRYLLAAVAALALALAVVFACRVSHAEPTPQPRPPRTTWPQGTVARIARAAPTITAAALAFGLDAPTFAAILAQETGMRHIRGGLDASMWGAGQVAVAYHLPALCETGIACVAEELLDPVRGVYGAAQVWAGFRSTHRNWPLWRVLAAYSCGGAKAAEFEESCAYSTAVLANVGRARAALAAGLAVRVRFEATP